MTDLEVLRKVIKDLEEINVPVNLTQQISVPLLNASNQLKQLHNAICDAIEKQKREAEKAEETPAEPEEPREEIVEEEPENETVEQSV